jgi:hypothetical protein
MRCLSNFLMVPFKAQKILILKKSNLSIFPFIVHAFGMMPKNLLPNQRHGDLSLHFLLRV